jgi:MFS family permease
MDAAVEGEARGQPAGQAIETDIPARLDRLPWSRFHVLIVVALGITWVLDGLEVTIVGSIGPMLQDKGTLGLTPQQIGAMASAYVAGAVAGALLFGWLTDRFGRRLVFNITLGLYVAGVLLSACSWNFISLAAFRVLTGLGIGGEYAAINSAIDELIPARIRGRIDLFINGSYWGGAALGAGASLLLLGGALVSPGLGWRLGFGIGGILGLGVLVLRRFVPESPRWLVTHGRLEEAEKTVAEVEKRVSETDGGKQMPPAEGKLTVHPRKTFGFGIIFKAMLGKYRSRSFLAFSLMAAQAFLFNAVFFTYGLVLTKAYHVPNNRIGIYVLPLALGNLLGPLCLGHFFDTVGRRKMIAGTYALSGVLMAVTGYAFHEGMLDARTQTWCWVAIFFVASAAASSAYLTASEIFPLETRALAIAMFYALGTLVGGVGAPLLFGHLIEAGVKQVAWGYGLAALLMIGAAIVEAIYGIDAEGKSLESIADPLSAT